MAPRFRTLDFRTIDGSGNNIADPSMNQTDTDFTRVGPANFADGFNSMTPGPNPREISNTVVAQEDAKEGHLLDDNGVALSGMMYAWGQFVDHDLDLEQQGVPSPATDISVTVPAGDQFLKSGSPIPITRVAIDPDTGVEGSPATAINTITGWLDGSQVYGSDAVKAASLRTADGHMKTSEGDNLPIVDGAFVAGDVRAAENPDLTALQVLFVREHNYQVDRLHEEHPNWSGDKLYETAKAITTAEMVNITYSEFLPHLLGEDAIAPYHGYDPTVDATISEEFEGAAYRFGHSIVSNGIEAFDQLGNVTSEQTLGESFFESPEKFRAEGADGLLRHLAGDLANLLDSHIVDGLRNLLVDPPAGIDLAAINIQRAHDLGLGTLNQTREALGFEAYTSFDQLSSDPETAAAFAQAYKGDINAVDLWAGGLAEDHVPGSVIGPTFGKIIGDQFTALRDGDRFYFENQGFDRQTLKEIKGTTLSDLILRDTDTTAMQADAFVATERHSGTLGGVDPNGHEEEGMAQLVVGSKGGDTLTAGDLNDTLVAARGRMTMTGGDGADTFVFNLDYLKGRHSTATITDFDPKVDKLQIFSDEYVRVSSDHHGGTLLQVGNDTIDLLDVKPNELHHRGWT
jgi:peroxidase